MNYNLSIVIPTKDRQYYCLKSVNQIVGVIESSNYNVEIVVYDNSEEDLLQNMILELEKKYIKYFYHGKQLSFIDNFDLALKSATGEYVLIIGDDDGVLPTIFPVLEFANKNQIDAVIPDLNVVYFWPNQQKIAKNSENGLLILAKKRQYIKKVNTSNAIIELMKNAGQEYQKFNLSRLYHGIIKRDSLKLNENKKYFGGLSPDIYASISSSLTSKNTIKLSIPVTISGISPKSGSSDSATGKHQGNIESAPHFVGQKGYDWFEKIPKIYSVETIWAETAIKALVDFGKEELAENFNYKWLEFLLTKKYKSYLDNINYVYRNKSIETIFFNLRYYYKKTFLGIFRKILFKYKKYKVESIETLEEVEKFVSSKYNERYVKKVFKKGEKIFNA